MTSDNEADISVDENPQNVSTEEMNGFYAHSELMEREQTTVYAADIVNRWNSELEEDTDIENDIQEVLQPKV